MTKRILWIDDDYYAIQGLFRPIEKAGYNIDVATSAFDGYIKAQNWKNYDLIVVDLIIPISEEDTVPDVVKNWEKEEKYDCVGIGLASWLLLELYVTCPVIILSVISDPILKYKLENLGLAGSIRKSGLLPTDLKNEIFKILKSKHV